MKPRPSSLLMLVFLKTLRLEMSTIFLFLFEDEHGNVVDESGCPKPIEYIVHQNEFVVETATSRINCLRNAASSKASLACPI